MKIAVAGIGYVGLSNAILLAQNHEVVAVDVFQKKVDMINSRKSPIIDFEIEEYLTTKELNLRATIDGVSAYRNAEYIIIATPTNTLTIIIIFFFAQKNNHHFGGCIMKIVLCIEGVILLRHVLLLVRVHQ